MNTQLQLVSFEQATKLKEHGFNWDCDYVYRHSEIEAEYSNCCQNFNKYDDCFSAPTIQHALMWYREVKRIECSVNYYDVVTPEYISCYSVNRKVIRSEKGYKSHQEAESALLSEIQKLKFD